MKDLRRFLLFTTLIAVLCTIICPSARGGPILFTTAFIANDAQEGKTTFGPKAGNYPWVVAFDGDAYIPAWGISVPYSDEVKASSEFNGVLYPSGEIKVGALASEGVVEGDDNLKFKGEVTFSMTIEPAPNAPPAPSGPIQILFIPTLTGHCKNETWPWGGGPSLCEADATASITDNTTGVSQSAGLPSVSGTGKATIYPALAINASEGDTFTINLTTVIDMGGASAAIGSPGHEEYDGSLGSEAFAAVDPLFEFADPSLSEYYSFGFSPNIPAPTPIPEPSSPLLFGTFLAGVCLAALRRSL
jgi:hypothetical protein